jgi:transcriptional regulator with XRE-family HTH domain
MPSQPGRRPAVRIEERIGANLRAAREGKGWSQEVLGEQVAKYLGRPWSGQTVSVAENGGRDFDAEDMLVLSLVLEHPVAWFYRPNVWTTDEIQLPSGYTVRESSMSHAYGKPSAEAHRIAHELEKNAAAVRLLGEGES